MPPKLPACKICSKKEVGKYRCPVCNIDYCSVPCFKTHKSSGCTSTTSYVPPILPSHPVTSDEPISNSTSSISDRRQKKRLRELNWPEEPDEALWGNPLHRDDLKPLRGFEYEAIATSPAIRSLLASPSLIQTLTRLTALPRSTKEPSLRLLLSLPPDPSPTVYRPSASDRDRFQTSNNQGSSNGNDRRGSGSNGRGGNNNNRGGRGGSNNNNNNSRGSKGEYEGRGLLESTAEERKGLNDFVEVILNELEKARQAKGEV